jgi:hypothetical protein
MLRFLGFQGLLCRTTVVLLCSSMLHFRMRSLLLCWCGLKDLQIERACFILQVSANGFLYHIYIFQQIDKPPMFCWVKWAIVNFQSAYSIDSVQLHTLLLFIFVFILGGLCISSLHCYELNGHFRQQFLDFKSTFCYFGYKRYTCCFETAQQIMYLLLSAICDAVWNFLKFPIVLPFPHWWMSKPCKYIVNLYNWIMKTQILSDRWYNIDLGCTGDGLHGSRRVLGRAGEIK